MQNKDSSSEALRSGVSEEKMKNKLQNAVESPYSACKILASKSVLDKIKSMPACTSEFLSQFAVRSVKEVKKLEIVKLPQLPETSCGENA